MRAFSALLLPTFVLSCNLTLCSQTKAPAKDAAPMKDMYAGESFVIEQTNWVYSENADGTGWSEHTVAVKLQSEASLREFGVVEVPFASASEHVEFKYIRVKHADGSITETPASEAIEQPEKVTRDAPFYSDLKQEQVPVKNMKVGDTLEWQARVVRTRAEAPNEFWGTENFVAPEAVVLEETIELRAPASMYVNTWTNPKFEPPTVSAYDGQDKVWHWWSSQLKPSTGPQAKAARKAKEGKVLSADEELEEEQGPLPSVAWTTFKSWADVGAWYRKLEGTRAQPDDELKAKVAELTANSKTLEDKVRAVYAYVSAQVRYVGVAFGVGRFQPHEASDVLHNQYGDCKDKATLLSSMLEVLGLKPDAVLIGAEIRMNEAVPSPASFNHLINRVKVNNEEVWLDATQEVAPYRVLLFALRDKQALVIPDSGPAELLRTPKDLPFPAVTDWVADGSLNSDGVSESHIKVTMRGDDEVILRGVVHQIAPANYDEFAQKLMESMGFSGTTSHASFSRPEDTAEPFTFEVDYHREKAGDWDNLKTIPQVAPLRVPQVDEKEPPTQSLNLGAPRTETSTSAMKLPEGWTAELPEAVHEKTDFASYDMTYRFEKGTVYTDRKLVVLKQRVPAADWKAYKKWTDAINLGFDMYIQLVRAGGKGQAASKGTAAGHVSSEETETLITQAFSALQKSDVQTAERLLKKARSDDPQARRLYTAEGWLAIERGKPNEAVDDFNKELAAYPRAYEVYSGLAQAQVMRKDKAAAEAALRQWAANVPNAVDPEEQLAQMLLTDNQASEAVDAATKALANADKDNHAQMESLRFLVGNAQLKAGMKDKGEATLVALLKETDNSGILNDASYELSDANLDLPLDEEKCRLALKKMDAETQSWTLDEMPATLAQKSSLLVAAWDTMGWILFREGKFQEAKSYIQPAWLNQHHDEVKGHLDQVDDKLGLAHDVGGKKQDQQDRTFQLGEYKGPKVTAEYRLLLTHGKAERVAATGDKSVPEAESLLRQASFAQLFPAGSDAKLVKTGFVNCGSGKCELVLEP